MSYTIKHRQDPNYFRLTISGKVDEAGLNKLTSEVIALFLKESPKKVLVDRTRLDGTLSLFGALNSIKTFPDELKNIKVAIVDSIKNEEPDRDYEMFATNHGFHVKFFTLKTDAELWLHAPGV